MLKFDTEFLKSKKRKDLFSDEEKYIRTIVMRFFNGTRVLSNIWREVYPPEDQAGATTLNDVSSNDL